MGVPHGSILGPLAFIIFINDLPTVVKHSSVHMYADDTVLVLSTDKCIRMGLGSIFVTILIL